MMFGQMRKPDEVEHVVLFKDYGMRLIKTNIGEEPKTENSPEGREKISYGYFEHSNGSVFRK